MHRDSIFYKLFQQSPTLLFELLTNPPKNAAAYRFDSVAVKEPTFEIDGVFLPPETEGAGVVYFCEVQFQKDKYLYERLFAESSLYFYRNRARFSDWQIVVIYPTRSIEQSDIYPHRSLLNGNQVHRVYLDEFGEIRSLPLWVALMVLTTLEESQAPEEARYLLTRSRQEVPSPSSRAIIEMVRQRGLGGFPHERLPNPKGDDDYGVQIYTLESSRGRVYARDNATGNTSLPGNQGRRTTRRGS